MSYRVMIILLFVSVYMPMVGGAVNDNACVVSRIKDKTGMVNGLFWNPSELCRINGHKYGWYISTADRTRKTLTHISLKDIGCHVCQLNVRIETYSYFLQKGFPSNSPYAISAPALTNFVFSSEFEDSTIKTSGLSDFGVPMATELLGIFSNKSNKEGNARFQCAGT